MSKYLSEYRNAIRMALSDDDESDYTWSEAQLDQHILHAVREVSETSPAERMSAFGLAASSKEIDISSLADRMWVNKLEYKVDQSPRDYRNVKSEWGDTLIIDTSLTPGATAEGTLTGTVTFTRGSTAISGSGTAFETELSVGDFIKKSTGSEYYKVASIASDTALTLSWVSVDDGADTTDVTVYGSEPVYVYWTGMHELTSDSSTLPDRLEQVVIDGAVAYAALAWIATGVDRIEEAVAKFSAVETAIDSVAARTTQAVSDLSSGRTGLATKLTEASTAIGLMNAKIALAVSDLSSGRGKIGYKLSEADTAIGNMAAQITQSITDLTSGRSEIGVKMTEANTAITSMLARIEQATTDITSGRGYMNKINKGGNVPMEYMGAARTELSTALGYLNQAKGYLAEDQPAMEYARFAAEQLSIAMTYLNQARAYMLEDQPSVEYARSAAGELGVAATYLNQAQGYLSQGQALAEYVRYAGGELSVAATHFNEARSHLGIIGGKLNVATLIAQYQGWANGKLVLYQIALSRQPKKKRQSYTYPEG